MSDTADAAVEAVDAPLNVYVAAYIKLRDRKAEMKAEFEKQTAAIDDALKRAEAYLLRRLQEVGVESVRTDAGTAYTKLTTSANVADWDAVLAFVKSGEHWGMLEKRVNKSFVDAFRTEHNDLPPGVNYRAELTLGVRRS